MSWFSSSATSIQDSATALASAAGKAYATEESESDTDEEQEVFQQKSNQTQSNSMRHSRTDLQTMPKLDSLYQTQTLQAKKRMLDKLQLNVSPHPHEKRRLALAAKIGKGAFMQYLGDVIFTVPAASPTPPALLSLISTMSLHIQAQESYTACLAAIMTSCSGLKAGRNASSPLLAKLAFHEPLLYGLWAVAKEKASLITSSLSATVSISSEDLPKLSSAYEIFASFCDIFSHNLLAVDDDVFIQKYHTRNDDAKHTPVSCLAKELVITLKGILNDAYWVRPVLVADISGHQVPNMQQSPDALFRYQRARLLLSGTKLWNSLYERWCRLYRIIQFCNEDSWWFPQLSSRGQHDNNPIIHSQVTSVGQDDDDAMDESSLEDGEGGAAAERNDAGTDALATSFRDPKMARILTCIPQCLPFNRRVDLFQSLLESDKLRTQDETAAFQQMMMNFDSEGGGTYSGREKVTIRRDLLYTDSMNSLMPLGKKLRKKLQGE